MESYINLNVSRYSSHLLRLDTAPVSSCFWSVFKVLNSVVVVVVLVVVVFIFSPEFITVIYGKVSLHNCSAITGSSFSRWPMFNFWSLTQRIVPV